ncbi:MAG: hypothetical protein AAFX90_21845 [Pseudomonadota bacterium]
MQKRNGYNFLNTLPVALYATAGIGLFLANWMLGMDWSGVTLLNWVSALSGWFATFAAAATIYAMYHQTRKNEQIAHRKQTEAKQLFEDLVAPILSDLNIVWKHIEDVINEGSADETKLTILEQKTREKLASLSRVLNELEPTRFLPLMHPYDTASCETILKGLKVCLGPMKAHEWDHQMNRPEYKEQTGISYFMLLSHFLSAMSYDLSTVSPHLGETFKNRSKSRSVTAILEGRQFANKAWLQLFPNNPDNPV